MKRPGPPPKPTQLKIIRGNPGGRDLNEQEPHPDRLDKAQAPDYLCEAAAKKWHQMVEVLSRNNVFTEMDVDLLAIYCEAHAIHLEASEKLRAGDATTTGQSGYQAQSPWVTIRDRAWKTKQSIMAEFGMSPAARTRINVSTAPRYGKKAQKSGLLDPL